MRATLTGAFSPLLKRVGRDLSLPLRRRARILRELAWDLEELTRHLVERGVPPEEARRRAAATLVPDLETLRRLDDLHAPLYRKLTAGVPDGRLRLAERGALAMATAGVLVAEGWALRNIPLLRDASPWMAPVLAAAAVLFALAAARVFHLVVSGRAEEPARVLDTLLQAAAVVLALGAAGALFDTVHLAATLEARPELGPVLILPWVRRTAVLLVVALLLALAGGLAWFLLAQWVALAEGARHEILALSDIPPHRRSPHHGRVLE